MNSIRNFATRIVAFVVFLLFGSQCIKEFVLCFDRFLLEHVLRTAMYGSMSLLMWRIAVNGYLHEDEKSDEDEDLLPGNSDELQRTLESGEKPNPYEPTIHSGRNKGDGETKGTEAIAFGTAVAADR